MNIEFLRIIFTIVIIIYHFIRKMGFDCNGGYAVEFFFVLSGYMLAKYSVVNPKYLSTCDYIFQKIKMFYPYIILGCIECYAFDPNIVKVLNTLSFSPNISNLKLVVCWYINMLLVVSLLYFYIIKNINRKFVNLFIGIILYISYIFCVKTNFLAFTIVGGYFYIGLFRCLLGMSIGYYINYLSIYVDKILNIKKIDLTIIEAFLLFGTILSLLVTRFYNGPEYILLSSVALISLFSQKKGYISILLDKVNWKIISKYVLPTYIMQELIVSHLFPIAFNKYSEIMLQHWVLVSVIVIILCWLNGILGYYIVELGKKIKKNLMQHN